MSEVIRIECRRCGSEKRNHRVVFKHYREWRSDCGFNSGHGNYFICECMGCDGVSFYQETQTDAEICDFFGNQIVRDEVFPNPIRPHYTPLDTRNIPERIKAIYLESVSAMNNCSWLLAGAGLRATVEALCIHSNTPGANLKQKIIALASQGILTVQQSRILDECRFIGNEALHEIETPFYGDIEVGLSIVEILLKTLFILPVMVEPVRKRRESRRAFSGNPPVLT